MTSSQIKKQLTEIIDSLVEDSVESLISSSSLNEEDIPTVDRNEAVDQLIKMIEFYREDL